MKWVLAGQKQQLDRSSIAVMLRVKGHRAESVSILLTAVQQHRIPLCKHGSPAGGESLHTWRVLPNTPRLHGYTALTNSL